LDLLGLDRQLFAIINQNPFHSLVMDQLMMLVSSHTLWAIIMLITVVRAAIKKDRELWWLIIAILASVAVVDSFSAYGLKPFVARWRPCHELAGVILPTGRCGGLYGFPSNHASNAGAVMAVLTRSGIAPGRWTAMAAILAGLVALSRVWLGVHYPGDVTAGLLLGFACGAVVTAFLRRWR
jgi:undecaprenyl-diphosphatase